MAHLVARKSDIGLIVGPRFWDFTILIPEKLKTDYL